MRERRRTGGWTKTFVSCVLGACYLRSSPDFHLFKQINPWMRGDHRSRGNPKPKTEEPGHWWPRNPMPFSLFTHSPPTGDQRQQRPSSCPRSTYLLNSSLDHLEETNQQFSTRSCKHSVILPGDFFCSLEEMLILKIKKNKNKNRRKKG